MNKTWKIVLIVLGVVLVFGAGIGYYFAFYKDGKKTDTVKVDSEIKATEDSETTNEFSAVTASGPSILFATHDPNLAAGSYKWIDHLYKIKPIANSSKEISAANTLVSGGFESVYANNAVQWSADSKVMAYAFGDEGGMEAPATPNSFNLVVVNSGVSATVVSGIEVSQLPKWVLMPDGKTIYYIKGEKADETAKFSLNKYDVASKAHAVLIADVTSYAKNSSPFALSADNKKLYLYYVKESDSNNLYRYAFDIAASTGSEKKMLDGVDKSTAFMGRFSESDIALSPDGTMLAYRKKITETRHGIAIYKFADKSSKDIYSPDDKRSVNHINWSPNSKFIAFETTFFGAGDGAGLIQGIYKVSADGADSVAIAEAVNSATNDGNYYTIGWSPDGKKIAYIKGSTLNYFDLDTNTAVEIYKTAEGNVNLKGFAWAGF